MKRQALTTVLLATLAFAPRLLALSPWHERPGFDIQVLVDGVPRPEYSNGGTTYVEALRAREYAIRITNPTGTRVAVALSVDGLNTIDAKRTAPGKARKWVIDPYSSVVISGWQVNDSTARRFTFTGERGSYGAFLGQTDNLGVIEAAFFREKQQEATIFWPRRDRRQQDEMPPPPAPEAQREKSESARPSGAAPAPEFKGQSKEALSDEYAATGMGDRTRHDVTRIDMDLESNFTLVRIRYEFRPQLVKLGVLPSEPDALTRREKARGFSGDYCPQP